jgi:hypothetical protein
MLKENQKGKNIVGIAKVNLVKLDAELLPNCSVGYFVIGDNINKYLFHKYEFYPSIDKYTNNLYEFNNPKLSIYVDDNNVITSIHCEYECYWQGRNLIKMYFEEFLSTYNIKPNMSEKIYLLVNGRGQNQMVHDFDDLGLQIWVWRKKIVTVIVSNYHDIKDE